MYMYIYTYITYVNTCINVYVYVCIYTQMYMHIYMCVCTYVCVYTHMCVRVQVLHMRLFVCDALVRVCARAFVSTIYQHTLTKAFRARAFEGLRASAASIC